MYMHIMYTYLFIALHTHTELVQENVRMTIYMKRKKSSIWLKYDLCTYKVT